jgi:hypothetical protein
MHKNKFDRNLVAIGTIAALWSTPALYGETWGNSIQYDNGFNPKAATNGTTFVEVHNGANGVGQLWYRVGQINTTSMTIDWGNKNYATAYDKGINPSVAISGSTVVEVHNATQGVGPLWMRIGQVNTSSNTILWGNSIQYDNGMNPSVAISGSTLVEVHNGANGVGQLWYRVGQITSSNTIDCGNKNYSTPYDNGMNPSVAIWGSTLAEVHNGASGVGPLWYRVGQINTSSNTITWENNNQAMPYDNGLNPTVAVTLANSLAPVEVHNGGYGAGPLWYHVGYFTVASTINWGNSAPYDNGMNPCVAGGGYGTLVEVHDAVNGAGPLWYRVGYLQHED